MNGYLRPVRFRLSERLPCAGTQGPAPPGAGYTGKNGDIAMKQRKRSVRTFSPASFWCHLAALPD